LEDDVFVKGWEDYFYYELFFFFKKKILIYLLILRLFSPLLAGVANHIEKLQRDFLWGGVGEEFRFHLVSWSKVCSLISKGGWGTKFIFI